MASVVGSSGKKVIVQMIGVVDTMNMLRKMNIEVSKATDLEIMKTATWEAEEVQESIMGNRDETKSVNTGNLASSIIASPLNEKEYAVKSDGRGYPDSDLTTSDVATILEYGTSKLPARRHFANTLERTKPEIIKRITEAVNKAV